MRNHPQRGPLFWKPISGDDWIINVLCPVVQRHPSNPCLFGGFSHKMICPPKKKILKRPESRESYFMVDNSGAQQSKPSWRVCSPYCGWRKSVRTTLKPWLKPLFVGIYRGIDSFRGFLGSAGFCIPNSVGKRLGLLHWHSVGFLGWCADFGHQCPFRPNAPKAMRHQAEQKAALSHRILDHWQGSLKDTFCNHLKHVVFQHKNKGKPPFTRQCSGV